MSEHLTDEEILEIQEQGATDDWGGGPARKAKAFWPSAKRLMSLFRTEKLGLVVVALMVLVAVVLNVWAPHVLGRAMDVIFGGVVSAQMPGGLSREQVIDGLRAQGEDQAAEMLSGMAFTPGEGIDFTELGRLILIVLGMYLVAQTFMWLQGRVLNDIVMRIVFRLREEIEAKINRLPLSYFDRGQRGDLLSRATNDVDNVQQALQQAFASLVYSVLTVIGIVGMMFWLSWQLALIALIALPVAGVVVGVIGKKSQALFSAQWRETGRLNGHIEESFTGHELVTVFGRQRDMAARFDERNEELYEAAFTAQFYSGMIMPIMQWVNWLGYVGIAVVGGLRVANGQMTLGAVTAFIQYSREFNQPLGQIAGMSNMLISGVASAERIFELLDEPEETPDGDVVAHLPRPLRGRVEFEHVRFSYTPEKPLITDLNLVAEPGQTVAIVGPTGAGKTTLVNLIMRFYEVDGGRILLDGVDTRTVSRSELRAATGMVLQDAVLFGGTIRENIRYGRLDATDEEVVAAAKATYVDRFVHTLPEGYDTVIEHDASNVSAGERQLITIARAFLAQPSLLILDEATSSVDTRTEVLVQGAMAALRSDRTSFVIAHRLSTIRDADVILVMEHGDIVEQGSHAELLAAKGAYHRLYMSQFKGGEDDDGAASRDDAR
ncbi:multidrug ABC transporter ATP-binding protein [Micrococcus luteus]|uniref:Fatty acid ABC transporter ATP-binding/permease protein n=2 Tax=Bacteria TaxID=2 RepID=A0AAP5WA71_9MICC|nr:MULTISPECIES: ABC transporter ATP-binding protein [Micrococcus]EZP34586.1 ABC transporter, ATP-binding protein [Micrococcus luteus]KIK87816.1 multidrug ABC transporter ATP-binding protein [Micrococcus luteus]MBF0755167.1 ABC transporter ATP-binding protein [Micrococcus aloeverae]MCT1870991.1 ABC transporter ATP-binding protein/permease [Micrococcus luteus]MCV7468561.1 ABC transporter ATP-binding protein/permease [Micrococcus luteus]